jgi:thioredoxin-like negative regulator of GroEL
MTQMQECNNNWRPHAPECSAGDLDAGWLLVHFWARWNAHDRQMDAVLNRLMLPAGVKLRSCDVDEQAEFAKKNQVGNIPALALFSRGHRIDTLIGLRDEDSLQAWLDRHSSG